MPNLCAVPLAAFSKLEALNLSLLRSVAASEDCFPSSNCRPENALRDSAGVIVGTPQAHEHRNVPISTSQADTLSRECDGKSRDDLVVGLGTSHLPRTPSDTGWFVPHVRACQAIDPTFPFVIPQDLHRTATSLAISAGANPKAQQQMLGHVSAVVTLDTYANLCEDDLQTVPDPPLRCVLRPLCGPTGKIVLR